MITPGLFLALGIVTGFSVAFLWFRSRIPQRDRAPREVTPEVTTLERKLGEAEERYKVLTENIAAAIVLHDTQGSTIWCSPFTEVLTGASRHEILSANHSFWRELVIEEDRPLYERALKIAAAGEPYHFRYRFNHRSGIMMWAETRSVPIVEPDADSITILSITLDVTASVRAQQQLEERNRDLHDFTYMVSHDLKAPINTIRGMLTLLDEMRAEAPEAAEPLDHISRAVGRLDALVKGILELARASSFAGANTPTSLARVIDEVREDFSSALSSVNGTLTVIGELPEVLGDHTRLYQVVSNLVGNAVKYYDPSRPLTVEVSVKPARSPRKTVLMVSDNGRGIPAHLLPEVFQPFKRAHPEVAEGSGVGLACVKKIVEKLGGNISVTSNGQCGTQFAIEMRVNAPTSGTHPTRTPQ
jgi:PAS domain S-box-containing protein